MQRSALKPVRIAIIWIVLILFTTLGLLFAAGCGPKSTSSRGAAAPKPVVTAEVPNRFVGSAACQSCHPTEFKLQSASRHATTLHLPDRQSLGRSMPAPGRVPGSDIILLEQQGALRLTVAGASGDSIPIDLAFGSGKTGMTYVMIMGAQLMELHKSYFPRLRKWYLTPGHEHQKPTDVAMMYKPDTADKCILCHAVTHPADRLKPEPQFFGVGCESCHGPGGAHVDAMQAGKRTDLKMADLSQLDATHLNDLCAQCHRGRADVMQGQQEQMTNRFQPYGLMKSRCFLESGNKLSCLTCHDPHTDASTNLHTYEVACLRCHSGAPRNPSTVASVQQTKVCPVNRTSGCIGCHMPKRLVFKATFMPTYMADHYIRVYAKK